MLAGFPWRKAFISRFCNVCAIKPGNKSVLAGQGRAGGAVDQILYKVLGAVFFSR